MGRALEPGYRFPIYLDYDEEKPEDQRPTIFIVALSMRKHEQLAEVWDSAPKTTSKEFFDYVADALANVITGWKNFRDPQTEKEIEFSRDSLKDVFTFGEARELFRKILASGSVSKDDEKN
jgi:hypothetical protein